MSDNAENKLPGLNNTADTTAEYDPKDIEQNKTLSLFPTWHIGRDSPVRGKRIAQVGLFRRVLKVPPILVF